MRFFLSLAIASLTLTPAAPASAAAPRPSVAAICAGEVLPFPVPEDAADISDTAMENWALNAWNAYCEDARPGSYEAAACACRDAVPAF